jgi:hypothetical protein
MLLKRISTNVAFNAFGLLAAAASAQTPATPSPADLLHGRAPVAVTHPMQKLQSSADHLRQSIQALAQKPPGLERDHAIAKAKEALLETQQAMIALPADARGAGAGTGSYDTSVAELIRSADNLDAAIGAMASETPGAARDRAVQQASQALLATQIALATAQHPQGRTTSAMGAGAAPSPAVGGSVATQRPMGPGSPPAGTLLALVPDQPATGTQLANGCWVRFYAGKNFQGPSLTLVGPVDMPRMTAPGGLWQDWDSAVAGPRATVTSYDKENYRERTATLRSGQSVPDLREQHLGWHEQVKSARVSCTA